MLFPTNHVFINMKITLEHVETTNCFSRFTSRFIINTRNTLEIKQKNTDKDKVAKNHLA